MKFPGGYVPGLILDPEEGIEAAIYAKNKGIDYSFKEDPFGAGLSDVAHLADGFTVMGNESLKSQAMSIDDQFAAITDKFGLPKNPVRTESIVSNSTNASAGPRKQKSVISKAADRLSKPKGGKNVKPIKKENKGLFFTFLSSYRLLTPAFFEYRCRLINGYVWTGRKWLWISK